MLNLHMHKDVVPLNSILRMTHGAPLGFWWTASQFDPTQSVQTVLFQKEDGLEYISQVRMVSQAKRAYLTLLGCNQDIQPDDLNFVFNDLSTRCQKQGALHLIAEVDHKHMMLERMKPCGFTVSAWQDIWKISRQPESRRQADQIAEWCPLAEVDWWQACQLLLSVTPPMSQLIDLPTRYLSRYWVCHKDTRIIAFSDICYGPQGIWIQPFFDPEVTRCTDLLCDLVQCLPPKFSRPVYISVRSYQSWLFRSIELLGADYISHQAILVKHLGAFIKEPAWSELFRFEKSKTKPSHPVIPTRAADK